MTTASDTTQEEIVSAALIVIGDEILSGRTKDKNIAYIADHLARIGIRLSEVRIVPDDEDRIALVGAGDGGNACSYRWRWPRTRSEDDRKIVGRLGRKRTVLKKTGLNRGAWVYDGPLLNLLGRRFV